MFHKFQLVALLALGASLAHAHSYDPMDPPYGTEFDGFMCTTAGGVVMQSNLPEGCAEWWPGCARKPDPPPPGKKCPGYCKKAYFKVRHVPIYGAEPYIHPRNYNSYSNNTNYSTYKYEGGGEGGSGKGKGSSSGEKGSVYGQNKHSGGKGDQEHGSGDASASRGESYVPPMAEGAAFHSGGTHAQAASSGPAKELPSSSANGALGPSASVNAGAPAPSAAGSAGSGRRPASLASSGDAPLTLEQAMALAEKAGPKAGKADFSAEAAATGTPAEAGRAKANYSDPWLDYIQGSSRAELVDKLEGDSKMRGDLRRKIDEMADGSGASDPGTREKAEYYRRALAEAEARLRQGGLKALQPLDVFEQEAFSMNGDETEREIKRLLAGMDDKAAGLEGDDGLHYPLFSRVHRSLWRQLANGNIQLKARKR